MKTLKKNKKNVHTWLRRIAFLTVEIPLLILILSYVFINPTFPFIIPRSSNLSLGIAPKLGTPYFVRLVNSYAPHIGDRVLIQRNKETYIGFVSNYIASSGDLLLFTSLNHPFWVKKSDVTGVVYWPRVPTGEEEKILSSLRNYEFENTKPAQYPNNTTQDQFKEIISYNTKTGKSSVMYGPETFNNDLNDKTIQLVNNKLFFVLNNTDLIQYDSETKISKTVFSTKDTKFSYIYLTPNVSVDKNNLILSEHNEYNEGNIYWLDENGQIKKQFNHLPYVLYSGYSVLDTIDNSHTLMFRMGGDGCGSFGTLLNKSAEDMKELIKLGGGCDENARLISYDSNQQKALLYTVVPNTFDTTIIDSLISFDIQTEQKETIYDLKGWKENGVQFIPNHELHSVAMLTKDVFQIIDYTSKKITNVVSLNWSGITQRHRDIFTQGGLWIDNKIYAIASVEDSYRPIAIDTETGIVSLIDIPAEHSSSTTAYSVYNLDKADTDKILFWVQIINTK